MKADSMLALVGSRTGPSPSPDAVGATPENAGTNSFDDIWMALAAPAEPAFAQTTPIVDQAPPEEPPVEEDTENPEIAPAEHVEEQELPPIIEAEQEPAQWPVFAEAHDQPTNIAPPIAQEQAEQPAEQPIEEGAHPTTATQPPSQIAILAGMTTPTAPTSPPPPIAPAPLDRRARPVSMMQASAPTGTETAPSPPPDIARAERASIPDAQAVNRTERDQPKQDAPSDRKVPLATAGPMTFAAPQTANTDGLASAFASATQTAPAALQTFHENISEASAIAAARTAPAVHAHTVDRHPHNGSLVARNISSQIVAHLTPVEPGVTEVTLSPEELGKVQLSVSTRDGVVAIVMMAERPETNDLLRRHFDALAQDFRAAGIDQLDLSMGDLNRDQSSPAQQDDTVTIAAEGTADSAVAATQSTGQPVRILPNDRLDLRM